MTNLKDFYEIELEEAYPDIRGRKVLVWVDDVRGSECKKIMDKAETTGVTCVHLHSTADAKEFFKKEQHLLQRGIDKLRIITDMVRDENKKQNFEAGLELALHLKDLKYTQGILCFTGQRYLEINQKKFADAGLPNVYASTFTQDAENFGKFKELPGFLPQYSTATPIKIPSSNSSSSSTPSTSTSS